MTYSTSSHKSHNIQDSSALDALASDLHCTSTNLQHFGSAMKMLCVCVCVFGVGVGYWHSYGVKTVWEARVPKSGWVDGFKLKPGHVPSSGGLIHVPQAGFTVWERVLLILGSCHLPTINPFCGEGFQNIHFAEVV